MNTFSGIKARDAVIANRIFFSRRIALAFAGNDMQELQTAYFLDVLQDLHQTSDVMAVHGSYIIKAEFLKQGTGHDHAFDMLLRP